MAENRFLAIERRLDKDPDLRKQYCDFMHDYESAGHMEPVQPPSDNTVCYYLPHHPVFKSTSTTDDSEVKKTLVALTKPIDITERYFKLSKLIRVAAFCKRFLHNCRQPPANRQLATLTTNELYNTLKCCIKLIQQNSYAQELHDLTTQQENSSTSSLKALHPFIDKEGILRVGEDFNNPHSRINLSIKRYCHTTVISLNLCYLNISDCCMLGRRS
jgi:hypothetical protein